MNNITFGLIGEKLGHSFSAPIHHVLGVPGYALYNLPREELVPLLASRAFSGLNVTIPYKEAVMPFCDELSETARAVGSVNTLIVNENGGLYGHNTDLFGFLYMTRRAGISMAGKKVAILGSGGTAKTALAAAKAENAAEIVVISRSGPVTYEDLSKYADAGVLINTTPVGMYPDVGRAPVDLAVFTNLSGVIDVIYNPLRTVLLTKAKALGIPHTGGLSMLVAQAVKSAELFLKQSIAEEKIEEVLAGLAKKMTNIVLIGMPGSGKSTLGRLLADRTGRPLVDTDALISEEAGVSIPQLFAEKGEPFFRDMEARAIQKAAFQTGSVIATGGGAVLRPENAAKLRQNGLVFFLQRPVAKLASEERPLSGDEEVRSALFAARLPSYLSVCDYVIGNAGAAEDAAEEIGRKLHEAFIS